jgi:hypothetical protein
VSKSFNQYNILKRSTISLKEKSFRLSVHFYIDLPATLIMATTFLTPAGRSADHRLAPTSLVAVAWGERFIARHGGLPLR